MPKPTRFQPSAEAATPEKVYDEAFAYYSARHEAELNADPKKPVNFSACSGAAFRAVRRWQQERKANA